MEQDRDSISIFNESEFSRTRLFKSRERLSCLRQLYPTQFKFPEWVPNQRIGRIHRPPHELIKKAYIELVKKKNASSREHERTSHERQLAYRLMIFTNKAILASTWIGHHCFDLFIPNVRSEIGEGRRMRGLAIEVDGDVHNLESKMRKDERKSEILQMIGVGQTHIPNLEFNEPTVKIIQERLKGLKPLDSRERRRLWKRIYLITIALQMNDKAFYDLFIGGGRHD